MCQILTMNRHEYLRLNVYFTDWVKQWIEKRKDYSF